MLPGCICDAGKLISSVIPAFDSRNHSGSTMYSVVQTAANETLGVWVAIPVVGRGVGQTAKLCSYSGNTLYGQTNKEQLNMLRRWFVCFDIVDHGNV